MFKKILKIYNDSKRAEYYKERHQYVEDLLVVRNKQYNDVLRERDVYREREDKLRDRIYSYKVKCEALEKELEDLRPKSQNVDIEEKKE